MSSLDRIGKITVSDLLEDLDASEILINDCIFKEPDQFKAQALAVYRDKLKALAQDIFCLARDIDTHKRNRAEDTQFYIEIPDFEVEMFDSLETEEKPE